MNSDLATFLKRHTPLVEESANWSDGALPLRIVSYLCAEEPPLDYVTSARAIVFQNDSVLVVRDPNGARHILPGGRCDAGETLEETLRREVLEETGSMLSDISLLVESHDKLNGRR